MNDKVRDYWEKFCKETNKSKDTKIFEVFYFGHNEHTAKKILELVLKGVKTATASSVYQYDRTNSEYPKVGDLSIVTDFKGNPMCVIETKEVLKLKFNEVTYEICKREGEDATLETWQQNHIEFFTEIGKKLDFEFSFDMDIIFEDFVVVYE